MDDTSHLLEVQQSQGSLLNLVEEEHVLGLADHRANLLLHCSDKTNRGRRRTGVLFKKRFGQKCFLYSIKEPNTPPPLLLLLPPHTQLFLLPTAAGCIPFLMSISLSCSPSASLLLSVNYEPVCYTISLLE